MTNIIEEIKELKNEPTHKSALRIYSLLENNKEQLLKKFEPDFFKNVLNGFENLAYESPSNTKGEGFKDQYNKLLETFLYRVNRM